jgi:site-specific recombinase XerD
MQGKGSTLDAAVRDFILDRQIGGCTAATIATYKFQLEPPVKWAQGRDLTLGSLTQEHLRQFLLARGTAGSATLRAATTRLKTFFRWCDAQRICGDLAAGLRKPRHSQALIITLSVDEVRAILSFCRGTSFIPRRDEALVRFLVDTAARVSEALDLTVDRLQVDGGRALLNGKGDKQRYVFFGQKTARLLMRYLAICESKDFRARSVFVNQDGTPMNRRHAHQTVARLPTCQHYATNAAARIRYGIRRRCSFFGEAAMRLAFSGCSVTVA